MVPIQVYIMIKSWIDWDVLAVKMNLISATSWEVFWLMLRVWIRSRLLNIRIIYFLESGLWAIRSFMMIPIITNGIYLVCMIQFRADGCHRILSKNLQKKMIFVIRMNYTMDHLLVGAIVSALPMPRHMAHSKRESS